MTDLVAERKAADFDTVADVEARWQRAKAALRANPDAWPVDERDQSRTLSERDVEALRAEIRREDAEREATIDAETLTKLGRLYRPGTDEGPTERPFAVEGLYVADSFGLIAGKPKNGKSTLATELAVSLATGTPMFGLAEFATHAEPGPVLVLQTENSSERVARDVAQILGARGVGLRDHEVTFVTRPVLNLLNDSHYDELRRVIQHNGFRYVVLDPIVSFIGDANISTWDNPLIARRLTRLRDDGCAPICTIQISERGRFDFASIIGATIWKGWMESGILVQRRDERDFTIKVDHTRDRDANATRTYTLRGLGVGRWELPTGTSRPAAEVGERRLPLAVYRAYVADHPDATHAEIAEHFRVSTKTVQRRAKDAVVR